MKNATNYLPKRHPDSHAYIDIIRRETSGFATTSPENWHEEIQFYYVVRGKGRIRCESETIDLEEGKAALVNSNELHVMQSLGNKLVSYTIRIDLEVLIRDMTDIRHVRIAELLKQRRIVFDHLSAGDERIASLLRELITEQQTRRPGSMLAMKAAVLRIIVILLRDHIQKIYSKKRMDMRISSLRQLKDAVTYIHHHYQTAITVRELAGRALMSEAHFCRTFKKLYGKSVITYINELRVRRAERLLRATPMTVTAVALATGFNDASYFSRVFKKYRGITPRQLRK